MSHPLNLPSMNKVQCLIVEDEPVAQRIIRNYLADLPGFELVEVCDHALDAMRVLENKAIDLMFLDLEMPKLKGFAFLKTLSNPPQVIITTAHREYALEGFELNVLDYLLKPIAFERFLKAIQKYKAQSATPTTAPRSVDHPKPNFIYVKSERKTLKLLESDIHYLEGMSNYILIHCQKEKHIVYASLTEMLSKLSSHFLRIHKSYVINPQHLRSFSKESVELGERSLPIGKAYKSVIEQF